MKIATWNVNSLNVRLGHLLDWLRKTEADVVALQETKLTDDRFPAAALAEAGYHAVYCGQRTYNGVAILSRADSVGQADDVIVGNPGFPDEQARLISASVAGLRIVCGYFPNGQEVGSDKYRYKLAWIDALLAWLAAPAPLPRVLLGDFNIAPEPRDVHDPALWDGKVLFSEPERDRFAALLALGMVDAFRLFEQPDRSFSWWDYRMLGFRRNAGLRIDHVLVDRSIATRVKSCTIDREPRKLEKPSDHAPVIAELGPAP